MHHIPFSLFGPNIFLKIFLLNTNNLLIMVTRFITLYITYVCTHYLLKIYTMSIDFTL